MNKTRLSNRLIGAVIVGIIAAIALAMLLGRNAGENKAASHAARLKLLWPNLMQMPKDDRAILVGFALTCNLEQRPLRNSEVKACLREGARQNEPRLPKGLTQGAAVSRLEALLATAKGSQP